jgi:hypothetical protein
MLLFFVSEKFLELALQLSAQNPNFVNYTLLIVICSEFIKF